MNIVSNLGDEGHNGAVHLEGHPELLQRVKLTEGISATIQGKALKNFTSSCLQGGEGPVDARRWM